MIYCDVSDQKIESHILADHLGDDEHGAQNYFLGVVRSKNFGKKVIAIHYDAEPKLAIRILSEISKEALEKWGNSLKVVVLHRTGELKVGDISVGIGVSSPHRDESYQASRYIIEQIKVRAPIWKKEIYEDGETEWLKGHALCQGHHHV